MPNLRYDFKHIKISQIGGFGTIFDESRLSQDLTDRIFLNFPNSYMAIRGLIWASLGEFLCAKLEIWLQTQGNISNWYGTQAYILRTEW